MAIKGGDIISYLELDKSKYTATLKAAQAEAEVFARENATLGQKVQGSLNILGTIGRGAAAGITLPIVGAMAASGKAAIEFESAFAGVRKTVDATEAEYARLTDAILGMGRVVPKVHGELAGIMEMGGQLGVPQQQLEKFTRTIADLDVATNLTGEAGASMLAQYANVTGMDIANIDRLGSVIVDLGNNTATTELDIVSMGQRLSGAASILKLTDAQTMGLAATMASLGINAEAGGSAMSRVMQRMLQDVRKGGEGLRGYAATAGTTADAFANLFDGDPLAAVTAFIDGLARINAEGGDVYQVLSDLGLDDLRITDSLLRMAGAQGQLEQNIDRANRAWEENTALTREAEQRYGTTASKIQLAKNSINEAGISLGNAFLPMIGDAARGVSELANRFADMDEAAKKNVMTGLGIAAAAGPAMLLLKGAIGLLSGPAGLVTLLGLAGAGVAGFFAAMNDQRDQSALEKAKELFGDVELSAEQIQAIIDKGFGEIAIDSSQMETAAANADAARDALDKLHADLTEKLYVASLGVDTGDLEALPETAARLVAAAQADLDAQEKAITISAGVLFDGNDAEGDAFLTQVNAHFAPLEKQLEDKGNALGMAIKNAIADGTIDDKEKEVIERLHKEIQEITLKGTMIDMQARADVIRSRAKSMPLTRESVIALLEQVNAYAGDQEANLEQAYLDNLYANARMYRSGSISKWKYERNERLLTEQYGNRDKEIAMSVATLIKDVAVDGLMETYQTEMDAIAQIISEFGVDGKLPSMDELTKQLNFDFDEIAIIDEIVNGANAAALALQPVMEAMQTVIQMLTDMQTVMGEGMPPELQQMLSELQMLQAFADGASGLERFETFYQMHQDAQEAGRKDGEAYIEQRNEAIVSSAKPEIPPTLDRETARQDAAETGAEIGDALVGAMGDREISIYDIWGEGAKGLAGQAYGIGQNTGNSLASGLESTAGRVRRASAMLGRLVPWALKEELDIRSPSRVMRDIANNVVSTYESTLLYGAHGVRKSAEKLGAATVAGITEGNKLDNPDYIRGYNKDAPDRTPRDGQTGLDGISITTSTTGATGAASKKQAASSASSFYNLAAEQAAFDDLMAGYNAAYERMLRLAGDHRAYYQKQDIELQLKAIEEKYAAMIKAENEGYEALSKEQQKTYEKAHAERLQMLQEQQNKELEIVRDNYDLQKRLAADWLTSVEDGLSAEFAAKQEAARAEDYAANMADLEKRIRQTRSARERRELSEELARMQRDEALRQEQQALQDTMKGFAALRQAASAGVIGLGDLLQDDNLTRGAGLAHVQGITADQLNSVLRTISERAEKGGNTYTIDLSGAVIRDDSDITRIVDAFEARMRSVARDYA